MTNRNLFYQKHYDFYKSEYWGANHNNITVPNGFSEYPSIVYGYFTKLLADKINVSNCTILDICCGNGLLLKHLIEHSNFAVIPYGVDFQENSIRQAKKHIHPNYCENFFLSNAIDFEFSNYRLDIIIIDPYHFHINDLQNVINNVLANAKIAVVFYCYSDVLNILNYKSVSDFFPFTTFNLDVYKYPEISIGFYIVV